MKLAIITIVQHIKHHNQYYGYAPYIREMNLWGRDVEELLVVGPKKPTQHMDGMDAPYAHPNVKLTTVPNFNVLSVGAVLRSLLLLPWIFYRTCRVMAKADHIHLRCPGNISLIGCVAQIFFPNTPKSTKYAGNWDPNSKQPWSYRLQHAILRNRLLTRNMQVLVYGQWPNEPDHILPFISATYLEEERVPFVPKDYNQTLEFVFAGALVVGKRPLLTIQIVEGLFHQGLSVRLHIYGDGPLMPDLQRYVDERHLEDIVQLYGNQSKAVVKARLQEAHFNILPSKSEGWPKAVAEGMFFGCIPIATRVSCVPWMLGEGQRGILIAPEGDAAVTTIMHTIQEGDLDAMARAAMRWSQQYTFDRLEAEIQNVLHD